MVANRYHLKCVIFAPEGFSEEKFQLCEYWVLKSNEHLKQGNDWCTKEARHYADKYDAVYMNQFETEHNPEAYTHTLEKKLQRHYHTLIIL